MFREKLKITRVSTGYIVTVWIIVVVMLGSVLTIGYSRNKKDLRQLMLNEAERLVEVVDVSATLGIHALDEVEYLTADRLFENARLIERLSRTSVPSPDTLTSIALANGLHMINILGKNGASLSRSLTPDDSPSVADRTHRPEVLSVLRGESYEEIIGFSDDRYYAGQRFGVVVARAGGGAVVVMSDSGEMLAFRKSVGLGTLLRELGRRGGIGYIVLQDSLGIVTATEGVTEMSRISEDPFLVMARNGARDSRLLDTAYGRVLEVARPLIVDDVDLGLLRIGLSTDEIDMITERAVRHFIILFATAMISGVLLFIYVMLRQNYMILDAEHDRILGDVRRMEEETRRSERLASMGRLAAGVAHEIRNPLNAISIIVQRMKTEFTPVADKDEYSRYLSTVISEIGRIGVIIEQFLKYARPPKLDLTNEVAGEIINDVVSVVGEQARASDISIAVDVPDGLSCFCDRDQFKQALLNIILNAIDAVGHDGTITITASRGKSGVTVGVTDSGHGMTEDVLKKVFDPYFTTREKGNGLGLSEVHRIVTAHGGAVKAANNPGGGAVFTIYMPDDRGKR